MNRALAMVLAALTALSFNSGCATVGDGDKTMKGVGIGTLAGAAVGAVWGGLRGDWAKGALIGAGAGAAIGGVTGVVMDKQEEDLRKAKIKTERDEAGRILVSMPDDVLKFDTGKWAIKASNKEFLDTFSGILVKYPENRIVIGGHTDNVGRPADNLVLSRKRAESLSAYLLAKGVPQRCIIQTAGYGEDKPVADNATAAGRAKNRRVDMVFGMDEDEAKKNQAEREKRK